LSSGVFTTIELQNRTATSDNTGTLLSQNISRQVQLLSDVAVLFLSPIVVTTQNGQHLDFANTGFSERYEGYDV
jgi:hypothetical protein